MIANPVLEGDFSDPDVIRVGDDYWMITSTMHLSPGMTVLHSHDLVTWSYVTHCVPDLGVLGDAYRADSMARFGRGIFAGSIRFHDGLYRVYFTTLDEGFFVTTAPHPPGPWSPVHRMSDATWWDDPCPIWEDGGDRAWLVASNPGIERWYTYLVPMSLDGLHIDLEARTVLDDVHTSEGNKVYQRGGWFYVLHNEVRSPGMRVAVIMRSRSMLGPWEKRDLLVGDGPQADREPCQGALVDHADGSWSFVTHHGRGGYPEGRSVSVVPVEWVDDWPLAGDGGRMSWLISPPVPGAAASVLVRDDPFTSGELGAQWQFNHAPVPGAWGLTGSGLRIDACATVVSSSLRHAPNTLSQRSVRAASTATVLVDVSELRIGGVAGLGHLSDGPSALLVEVGESGPRLRVQGDDEVMSGPEVSDRIWLRTSLDERNIATFAFSADGVSFTAIGGSHPTRWSDYRGSRIALYCFADREGAGAAEFSRFSYQPSP